MSERKSCFIITPIGGENTEIRRSAEGIIDALIEPILSEMEYEIHVAHRMNDAGSITQQLLKHIIEDDLVIVNLTGLNPNVMYELAVRHAARKPIIQICEVGTILPFDITDQRTIFYTNDMMGIVEIREKLKSMIREAIKDDNPDNPIYRAIESNMILKQVETEDAQSYIIHKLDQLESRLTKLNTKNPTPRLSPYFGGGKIIKVQLTEELSSENQRKLGEDIMQCCGASAMMTIYSEDSKILQYTLDDPDNLSFKDISEICENYNARLISM